MPRRRRASDQCHWTRRKNSEAAIPLQAVRPGTAGPGPTRGRGPPLTEADDSDATADSVRNLTDSEVTVTVTDRATDYCDLELRVDLKFELVGFKARVS